LDMRLWIDYDDVGYDRAYASNELFQLIMIIYLINSLLRLPLSLKSFNIFD
jgi:hypothetical protein